MPRTRRGDSAAEIRLDKVVEFLEAAYDLESDDQAWLSRVMEAGRAAWTRCVAMHGGIYDASDIHAFRLVNMHLDGFCAAGAESIMKGPAYITPELVTRVFRTRVADTSEINLPEMAPMNEGLSALGLSETLYLNTPHPDGRGVLIGFWARSRGKPPEPQMALVRRMAHHLGAAYRCRGALRGAQTGTHAIDATEGAAAILDTRNRVVHATGLAKTRAAQRTLIEAAQARARAHTSREHVVEGLERWRPLTATQWSLVDSFEHSGARYVVARENACTVTGLAKLSHRERQVVAYAAIRQSTKETAYALGISDTTVRVLLARAAAKLGVRSRAELLQHPEVVPLRPESCPPIAPRKK